MNVPTDFKLTEERGFELDGSGDIATVTDQEFVKQEPSVRILNQVSPNRGGGLTRRFVEELESDIEGVLEDSEWVSEPFDIEMSSSGDTLTVSIETADETIETDL